MHVVKCLLHICCMLGCELRRGLTHKVAMCMEAATSLVNAGIAGLFVKHLQRAPVVYNSSCTDARPCSCFIEGLIY